MARGAVRLRITMIATPANILDVALYLDYYLSSPLLSSPPLSSSSLSSSLFFSC